MSYATVETWLTDQAELHHVAAARDGGMDTDLIGRGLAAATAEMDGWLARRYPTVPVAAAATLRMHAVRIATYHMASTAQSMTDEIDARYKASISYLRAVSKGDADLPGTQTAAGPEGQGTGEVQIVAPERLFTRDKLKGL